MKCKNKNIKIKRPVPYGTNLEKENSYPMVPTSKEEKITDDDSNQHRLKMVQHFTYPVSFMPTSTVRLCGPNNNTCYSSIASCNFRPYGPNSNACYSSMTAWRSVFTDLIATHAILLCPDDN